MKKLLLIMLSVSLLTSCGDGSKSKRIVSASSGNINNLQVIIDSELWLSRIGDELREVFSAEGFEKIGKLLHGQLDNTEVTWRSVVAFFIFKKK